MSNLLFRIGSSLGSSYKAAGTNKHVLVMSPWARQILMNLFEQARAWFIAV